jgi:signal peptidase I
MKSVWCLGQSLWKKLPCRLAVGGIIALLVGVSVGRHLLGSFCIVSGTSMLPTLSEGSLVRAEPISMPIDRGDVVVMDDGGSDYAIKRIVGLPGETVHIWRGYVYINGRILLEPYVPKRIYTFPRRRLAVFKLGEEQYFVLGDNRPCSADSRLYGPVERGQLKKRVPLPDTAERARFGPFIVQPYGTVLRQPFASLLD